MPDRDGSRSFGRFGNAQCGPRLCGHRRCFLAANGFLCQLGDPIERLKQHLISLGEWSDEQHRLAIEEAAETVRATGREAEKIGTLAEGAHPRSSMFDDVYKDMPWHLRQQRDEQGN